MAGDTKEVGGGSLPEPLDALAAKLDTAIEVQKAILDEIAMNGWEIIAITQTAAGGAPTLQSQHAKLRLKYLVIGNDSAGATMILSIGTSQYSFIVPIGTLVIPFPILIERAADLRIAIVGGGNGFSYLIGKPE